MGMLCSLDLMFKKKIIFLFLLLFSSVVIFGNTNNQTLEVCKYFKGGDSKKKFNPFGEMYVDKSFGFGNENSLKLNYKNGKPVGEMEEYYDNGKLYRKSTLRKKNNFHPFSNPDDFKDYVEYYEIYDMNTGEIVKKESLANKTGIIWRYNSKTGKLEMESHLENGKIFFQKEYGEDGKIIQEYNY